MRPEHSTLNPNPYNTKHAAASSTKQQQASGRSSRQQAAAAGRGRQRQAAAGSTAALHAAVGATLLSCVKLPTAVHHHQHVIIISIYCSLLSPLYNPTLLLERGSQHLYATRGTHAGSGGCRLREPGLAQGEKLLGICQEAAYHRCREPIGVLLGLWREAVGQPVKSCTEAA